MDSDLLKGFYLGDFLVEPAQGRVTGRHGSTHLPPKAMEVLLRLAGEPTEIVERDELLAKAWGASGGSTEALSNLAGMEEAIADLLAEAPDAMVLAPLGVGNHVDHVELFVMPPEQVMGPRRLREGNLPRLRRLDPIPHHAFEGIDRLPRTVSAHGTVDHVQPRNAVPTPTIQDFLKHRCGAQPVAVEAKQDAVEDPLLSRRHSHSMSR